MSKDTVNECGVVRPGTLGYQRCLRVEGHAGQHQSQDRWPWSTAATPDEVTPSRDE